MPPGELDRVERRLLLHLLQHHGQQVRFEASQWVTEFGIVRQFTDESPDSLRRALRSLEMSRPISSERSARRIESGGSCANWRTMPNSVTHWDASKRTCWPW